MGVLIYATASDLATWTGQPAPDNAAVLLRSASMAVRAATRTAIYTTSPSGLPSDADVAEAFRDATCEQAGQLTANDIDPAAGAAGAGGGISASSIGSASVTYATPANDAALRQQLAAGQLCASAVQILLDAGVLDYSNPLIVRSGP